MRAARRTAKSRPRPTVAPKRAKLAKPRLGFSVLDADAHVFEPTIVWEKFVDRDMRALARSSFYYEDVDGVPTAILNGKPAKPMSTSRINRQAIWRPGMTPDDVGALDPTISHPTNPGATDARARLADMDALGIERQILFPTLFAEYLPVVGDPLVAHALARAYNDWIWELTRRSPRRLVPVAMLPTQDPNLARKELRRIAKRGFRLAFLRPAFVGETFACHDQNDTAGRGRFLNHPSFDPLWTDFASLGVVACVHPSPGGTNPEWTSTGATLERVAAALRTGHPLAESIAPTMDAAIFLTAVCFYGHMERFPKLRFSLHHAGASWVTLALEKAETYLWLLSSMKDVSLEPADVFFARESLVTFNTWESSVARLPETYGRVAAWGSRYPHHDASGPEEAIENLRRWQLPDEHVASYMGGNAARFYDL